MQAIVFLVFLMILMFFILMSLVLLFHLSKYRLKKEHHTFMMTIFTVGSLVLVFFELVAFSSVDWEGVASATNGNSNANIDFTNPLKSNPLQDQFNQPPIPR